MTTRREALGWLTVAALAFSGVACGDGDGGGGTGPGTEAGTIEVSLSTPNADDGAVLIRISGPGITSVAAFDPSHVVFNKPALGEVQVILVGDNLNGAILKLQVADVNALTQFTGTVLQAAKVTDELQSPLTSYGLSFATSE